MAYSGKSGLPRFAVRLLLGLAIGGIMLTGFGLVDAFKDLFASHRDINYLSKEEFRVGDIVRGTVSESLGYAATVETTEYTMHIIKGKSYTSGYYYVIPFFKSIDDSVPEKIIMYKTGNKAQIAVFESLIDETYDYYYGEAKETNSHVNIERAEVCTMNAEEKEAFDDFIHEFVYGYFEKSSASEKIYLENAYKDAMVPYLVEFHAQTANVMLPMGIGMLAILVIVAVIYIIKKNKSSSSYNYVQTSAPFVSPNNDPNLNSPTGLKNASDMFYRQGGNANAPRPGGMPVSGNIPSPQNDPAFRNPQTPPIPGNIPQNNNNGFSVPKHSDTYGLQPGNKYGIKRDSYRKDYSHSERPLPPVENANGGNNGTAVGGTMMYDPQTGMPVYTSTFGSVTPTGARPAAPVRSEPAGESMPSVDPASEEFVDISNGGLSPEEKVQRNAVMPHNGNIPVINPDAHNYANMFGTVIPAETKEPVPEKPAVEEIRPATSADNISADFQVEQTDPEMRNMLFGASGGDMNAVDPYTEKNVDVSNGGIELDEEEQPRSIEKKEAPSRQPAQESEAFKAPQQPAPAAPTALPEAEPQSAFKEPAGIPEKPEAAPERTGTYSIFDSGSKYSTYTSNYTGGSSYNIFKKDPPKPADDAGSMGFPVTEKDFPKPDNSFPEAGSSDVGGKDDFIF